MLPDNQMHTIDWLYHVKGGGVYNERTNEERGVLRGGARRGNRPAVSPLVQGEGKSRGGSELRAAVGEGVESSALGLDVNGYTSRDLMVSVLCV